MDRGRQSLNLLESHKESMGIREKGVKVCFQFFPEEFCDVNCNLHCLKRLDFVYLHWNACNSNQVQWLTLHFQVGYHGQEAVRDGEGHGQNADLVIVSNLNEIVDVGGGVVLLLTSQHLPLHHLPWTLEKKSAFISGNSSAAPSTGSVEQALF